LRALPPVPVRILGRPRHPDIPSGSVRNQIVGPAAASVSFAKYAAASNLAFDLGVGVNAGHDLDLKNLTLFKKLPHLDEVSIGHALIGRAIFVGLGKVVKEYLAALSMLS